MPARMSPFASPGTFLAPSLGSPTFGDAELGAWKLRLKVPKIRVKSKTAKDIAAWVLAPSTGGASVLARYATRRGRRGRALIDVGRGRATRYRQQVPSRPRRDIVPGMQDELNAAGPAPEELPDTQAPVAISTPAASGPSWGLWIAAGLGLVLVLGGIFAFTRKGRGSGAPSNRPGSPRVQVP